MIRGKIGIIGGVMAIIGLGGMSETVTGQGSFLVSMIVLSIGIAFSLYGLRGET